MYAVRGFLYGNILLHKKEPIITERLQYSLAVTTAPTRYTDAIKLHLIMSSFQDNQPMEIRLNIGHFKSLTGIVKIVQLVSPDQEPDQSEVSVSKVDLPGRYASRWWVGLTQHWPCMVVSPTPPWAHWAVSHREHHGTESYYKKIMVGNWLSETTNLVNHKVGRDHHGMNRRTILSWTH